MTARLKAWAARSGLICWLAGEHSERRVQADGQDYENQRYNRVCIRCGAKRLAKERKPRGYPANGS